ncbi:hypothetical protein [Cryptosporangium sp. NPDC051539]|uniref:hypothetical protein n=1 Tax=Cryptosporangium sp. NPDC051539 TaxID=3363962 RepID=UPI003793F92B
MKVVRLLALLALTLGALVALPAAPASAAISGIHDLQDTVIGPKGQKVRSRQIPCPTGETLVAAGAGDADLTSLGGNASGFQHIRAAGLITGDTPNNVLSTTTTCAPTSQLPADTTVSTVTITSPSTGIRTGFAPCKLGQVAFGGGGYFVQPAGLSTSITANRLIGSAPAEDGSGWKVTGATPTASDVLVVRTLCGTLNSVQPAATTVAPTNGTASRTATCPTARVPLSGGVYLENKNGGDSASGILTSSRRVANGWSGSARNLASDDRMVVRVRCV